MNNNDSVSGKNSIGRIGVLPLENFKQNYYKVHPVFQMLGFEAKLENEEVTVYNLEGHLVGTMKKDWTMGGTTLELETEKGNLTYITCVDGRSNDGGEISRNIVRLNNLKQINNDEENKQFVGKYIDIELGIGEIASSNIPRIEVKIIDPNAENIITEFRASSYSFTATLENDFGPWGNYVDGTHRSISYEDYYKSPYRYPNYFMSFERVWNGEGHYVNLRSNYHDEPNRNGITFETTNFRGGNTGVHDFKTEVMPYQIDGIAKQLLASSRSKNLFEYVLDSLNTSIPEIRNYIMKNFDLISVVENLMNTNNYGQGVSEQITQLFEMCRVPKADLAGEKSETLVPKEVK